ncbi:MAG: 4Fe-4S dicluster domain-containing protein [Pelosinus sp.]|nr:4Fe-4S dicluster domain-containing protein [Pelosinus sp.]
MPQITEVVKIRRKVLAELARLAFSGNLEDHVEEILQTISTENGVRYRCCVHKERAILKQRINIALHQPIGTSLKESASNALAGKRAELPAVNILPEACDKCPIDRMLVTDACRNCLAHHCINSCPKKAIVTVQNKAYIDNDKCVECGMCKNACPYGAIIEIRRPCERACDLGAIKSGEDRKAVINSDLCVSCGACATACPFGAISDSSCIVQLIQSLHSEKRVYAILAPAFVGQLGIRITTEQIITALKQLGFHDVWEASAGADIVVLEESKEYVEAVPAKQTNMTTSCCPSFVQLVEKHIPELQNRISTVVSPMIATGKWIKEQDPEALVAFIGPCFSKKGEAKREGKAVDFVLTFEELSSILAGSQINLTEIMAETKYKTTSSHDGNAFACSGGVAAAVENTLHSLYPDTAAVLKHCEGLGECLKELKDMQGEKSTTTLLEGMACTGGCIGGPGALLDFRVTRKQVEKYSQAADTKHSFENTQAVEQSKNQALSWHKHHNEKK